ncbi:PTS sugar transporter subunit IIA [Acholeplasma hippikon]|nr:PTS sugar transporter subunit IIA [Acholeplasma hippikon]
MKLLQLEHIEFDVTVENKDALFTYLANKLYDLNRVTGANEIKEALLKREKDISTGVGDGIGIPHTKDSSVLFPTVLYLRLKEVVPYEALDGISVKDVFCIVMPTSYNKEHLVILSKIAQALLDETKAKLIRTEENKEVVFEALKKEIMSV